MICVAGSDRILQPVHGRMPEQNQKKKVVLVGHCGPDSSYLRLAVQSAVRDAQVLLADDESELSQIVTQGAHLLLLNRELDWGFSSRSGVEMIRKLKPEHPELKFMLVSNYPEAQAEAEAAGALQGFGKRELGSPRVKQLLQSALQG
jgi:hypothetical protein